MYKNSVTHYITKILVDILFFGGILSVIVIPDLARVLTRYYHFGKSGRWFVTAVLFITWFCAIFILFNLKQMFKTLLGGNPFIEANVRCFRKMAVACAIISIVYALQCFLVFSVATFILVAIFTVGTLFCLTLKDVFKQAIYYKEEHDWTV
jgi:hypothetical protein